MTFNKSCFTVLITICVLLSVLNRNASIVSFTFGVFNLVFWLLTYCQCPFPCDQYQGKHCLVCSLRMRLSIMFPGMCESKVTVKYLHCRDKVLVWVWPALSIIGLVINNTKLNEKHNSHYNLVSVPWSPPLLQDVPRVSAACPGARKVPLLPPDPVAPASG